MRQAVLACELELLLNNHGTALDGLCDATGSDLRDLLAKILWNCMLELFANVAFDNQVSSQHH
jgi:hypothetical protein